nr:immunoglobulin light chain junction region [Homo sapiens]
ADYYCSAWDSSLS